jgi:hypothetical protein
VASISAPEYLLRINSAGGPPGAKTPVHTHPGSETFYVLTGELSQKTPYDMSRVAAGQSMPGHGPGTPMGAGPRLYLIRTSARSVQGMSWRSATERGCNNDHRETKPP